MQIFQIFLFVLLHFVWGQINPDIFNRLSQYVIHTKSVFSKGILDFLIKCQRIHFFKIRGAEIINLRVWNPIPYHCTFNCGTGIFLFNQGNLTHAVVDATAFGILQAGRIRTSKTEYISCPGCGRTLFDLQSTIARVKAATSHLKGLKIGIMGCIVNGPGEMADADYGYVGAGRGKISLYKKKECIEKNIPEEEAVEKLIELIKANGDYEEK